MQHPPARIGPRPPAPRFAAFQPDALEIMAAPSPVRSRLTLYLLLAFVLAAVAFASLTKVDRIVAAPGKLTALKKNIPIQPLDAGVVREVLVVVGQRVDKGQPLVALDPTAAEAGLGELEKRKSGLAAKVWRLNCEKTAKSCPPPGGVPEADLALERDILAKRRAELAAKTEALSRRVGELAAKLTTNAGAASQAKKQIALARDLERMYDEIYTKGASAKIELMKAQASRIEAESQLIKLGNESKELAEALSQAKSEKDDFVSNWQATSAKDLADASRDLAGVEEQLRKARRAKELVVLTAPEAGVVLDVPARPAGSVAGQGETVLTLVPLGEELLAETEVAAQDIGLIRVGDPARIKLEAFPFQRHGTISGVVQSISPDAFEKNTPEGQRLFYRARLAVTDAKLTDVPPDFRLIPGMTLTAEIKIGTRRVITYLTYPLVRSFDESLREP